MQRLIWTVLFSFIVTIVIGPVFIPFLKRMKFGQNVYELGPESHKVKQGIPTMGGIIFVIPIIIVSIVMAYKPGLNGYIGIALLSVFCFGAIGFIDDFTKIKKKRSMGLTPKQKMAPLLVLAAALSLWAYFDKNIGSKLIVPFINVEWDLGYFYVPVMIFIIVATVNSANLLDGLDGLLAGCSLIDFITMALILMAVSAAAPANRAEDMSNLMLFCGACAGSLLGFLRFNTHPASVFMGDVGSFAIGGALVSVMVMTRLSLLLPIIALPMVVSSLSDLIQFAYFRKTHGKRIFKMAPLHHHFELSGIPETRIVSMYMIITALLCLVALMGFVS